MNLYHGSTYIVKNSSLEILNFKRDFGKGFYTTIELKLYEKIMLQKKKQ